MTAKDPICGMEVNADTSKIKEDFKGKTYYFCSQGCKEEFDKNPSKFTSKSK